MNRGTYRKLWAILGAGVLTLGVVTVALALELKVPHQGITVSWDSEGNAVIDGGEDFSDSDECEAPAQGEVIFHFVQSGQGIAPNAGGEAANTIDVDFEDEADVLGWAADDVKDNNVDWFVSVDASDGEVTLVTANSNVNGGELRVSHICVGDAPEIESAPPSEVPSDVVETDEPSDVIETDEPSQSVAIETDEPSDVIETDEPSQSVAIETDEPSESPFQSVEGDTDEPSEPDTATIGGSKHVGSPADGAWLLVVALGVLLASVVVLTPARAKAPRR
jgi:hypothetical protein